MRSLRFVFVVVVLCLPAVFVGGGQVSAQGGATDVVFQQRTTTESIHGGTRFPVDFLSNAEYPRSNRALNSDNTTVSDERATNDVGYVELVFDTGTNVGQNVAEVSTYTIPQGWTIASIAATSTPSRQFLSWPCGATAHSVITPGSPTNSFAGANADNFITLRNVEQILPYARQITETHTDNSTRTRCVAPEGLGDVTSWFGDSFGQGNFDYAAYTPETGWTVDQSSIDTPVYIVPTEPFVLRQEAFAYGGSGSTGVAASYTTPISDMFEVMLTLDSSIVRRDLNGFGAISATCTGGRDSADSADTMEFCTITAVDDVFEPVIADGDLPTFSPQAGASASLVNCGFAVNNQCRDISSNTEASSARTLAANTVQDFVLKPRSDTTLRQVELALGVPFVGAPLNSADSTITVELARDYTARAGYTVGTVTATGTSVRAIDENDVELALKPCSATSTETCLEITLNSVYIESALANPIYAITVTNTSNQQNTIYTR